MLKKIILYALCIYSYSSIAMDTDESTIDTTQYPSAVISVTNDTDCSILFSFIAGSNKFQLKVDPNFMKIIGSEHRKSLHKIHHAYKLNENKLKVECLFDTQVNKESISLPTYQEKRTLILPETHTTIICSKTLALKGLFDVDDQYELNVEVNLDNVKSK